MNAILTTLGNEHRLNFAAPYHVAAFAVYFPSVKFGVEFDFKHDIITSVLSLLAAFPVAAGERLFLFVNELQKAFPVDFDARTQNNNRKAQL